MSHLMSTYNPLPIQFTHGQGVQLWDTDNKAYLDAHCGIAVTGLGHAHPAIVEAITDQAKKLLHTSNAYQITEQQKLADLLIQLSGMENAFFCNSGAEANETALKLARLYGHHKNIENPEVIVMEGAFHGRTLAMISASGNRKVQAGFEPLVRGFVRAPFNDIAAIEAIAQRNKTHTKEAVVAIMVEPIQGEGGIIVPDEDYLVKLRTICDANDWLLMLDEVQTGICRTGKFFAYQHAPIQPDVLMLAKGLGNGIPIGACLARGKAAQLFQPGNHGSTFGGNPFASRVARTVLEICQKENIAENAAKQGKKLLDGLKANLSHFPEVRTIRGKGLMIGIELDRPCRELLFVGIKEGLLFNVTADKVIRLLPPLIADDSHIQQIIEKLTNSLKTFLNK